jgi:hypothetical protein
MFTAITTTMGVINSIHNYSSDTWPYAHMTAPAGFPKFNILVLLITNNTHASSTVNIN